ncbi:MAG: LPS export ABC transporter permease LptG [Pseudomonadota bacterium]
MRILDWYIGKLLIRHIIVTIVVLLGLFTFVSFLDELGDLDRGAYGIFQIIQYVILTIPNILYQMFPMAALIGSILGLSTLARDSELIVMRAAGVSVLRIVGSVLKVGAILAVVAVIMGEVIAPFTETRAVQIKAESIQDNIRQKSGFGVWLRDENTYVNIGEVLPDLTLLKIKIFEFDNNNFLRFLSTADQGVFEGGRWLLKGLRRTMIDDQSSAADAVNAAYWTTAVSPDILNIFKVEPEQLSVWQLNRYIDHLKQNKQETNNFELTFWSKIVTPFATAAMLIMAVPFVFQSNRSGGMGRNLFTGIMIGLGFFILNKSFSFFVPLFSIPPFLGAVIPTLLVCFVSIFMIRRIV